MCIHFVFLDLVCFFFFVFFFFLCVNITKKVVSSLINKCTFQLCVVQVLERRHVLDHLGFALIAEQQIRCVFDNNR